MKRRGEPLAVMIRYSSIATLIALAVNYTLFYAAGIPLWTDHIAEWIMAHTPSRYAVPVLNHLGAWAKPWASTGALAFLGFVLFLLRFLTASFRGIRRTSLVLLIGLVFALGLAAVLHFPSATAFLSFWLPALAVTVLLKSPPERSAAPVPVATDTVTSRRSFLVQAQTQALPIVMAAGTVGVAVESYLRNEMLARSAVKPVPLFPFQPALDRQRFANGLVRKAVTPVREFYGMSKDTVDPAVDPRSWKLRITFDGRPMRTWSYTDLLALPRQLRYQTLRCISNTLKSDLMGTAQWAGVSLSQLVDRRMVPEEAVEVAFIGVESHDDSLKLDYAFGEEALLALGMNGKTLSRVHGFPLRLLAPRYYGCRNVKWIGEIRFVTKPYYGTWQRMGYTKEPVVHIASHVDHQQRDGQRVRCGGVSFAGDRGIRAVRARVNNGSWFPATLESPLSPFTWTRWCAEVTAAEGDLLEINAQDNSGAWQQLHDGNPFPTGLAGPTLVRISV